MIYYRNKYKCKIAEIWYNFNEKPDKPIDIFRYKFVQERQKKRYSSEDLFSLILDLNNELDELFSKIKKNTKYEIKRAKNKDNIKCHTLLFPNDNYLEKVTEFLNYYNKFADTKNRNHIDFSDIEQFYNTGNLCIRYAVSENNSNIFCMHSYVISDKIARLLQSASHFRESNDTELKNLTGRANRLLHWDDIIFFKNLNFCFYDFGGWYGGQELKEQLLINTFKESFGGEKKSEYSYLVPVTIKGYFFIYIREILKFYRSLFIKHA